ncbi:hypothetical protein PHYC_03905 [Phycisphaerales bacterium]|nr:hypothetical protein PHYC_03905 [Phycisphaerales bacterium]
MRYQRERSAARFAVVVAVGIGAGTGQAMAQSAVGWGANGSGQLGDGTTVMRPAPVNAFGMESGVTWVAAGRGHSLVVRDGAVFGCGWGWLVDGASFNHTSPVAISGMSSGVTAVYAGYTHSLAIQNGGLFAWGENNYGQLGEGQWSPGRAVPQPVVGLSSGVTAAGAGIWHSLAVQNGVVFAWGDNQYGQLGDGTLERRYAPVAVAGLPSGFSAVAAGSGHNLALRNGRVYAWGWNGCGELGDGTTTMRNVPVEVIGLDSVSAIAASGCGSLAVRNGEVFVWGMTRLEGDLLSLVPTRVPGLSDIVRVAASAYAYFALAGDGSLWVWGSDYDGELGLGTSGIVYTTPQHLVPPEGFAFTAVEADSYGAHALAIIAPAPPLCDPDVNCDGADDGLDIRVMEQAVNGDLQEFCQADADFNRDGSLNGFDVEAVELGVLGWPCP